MALRFFDGFDHYPANEMGHKWTTVGTMTFVTGRFGGSGLQTNQRTAIKVLTAKSTWVVGMAMRNMGNSGPVLHFLNGASTVQDTLHLDHTTGRLSIRRAGTVTVAQGVKQLAQSTWYYIEVRLVISDASGVAHIKIDGVTDIEATSVDTLNSGSTADRIQVGDGGVSNINVEIDDFYVLDGDGSAPYNDFLGDCRVEALYPNGNGTTSDFDGSDGNSVDNYLLVDETNSDDDTTYVESQVLNEKDTYNYGALSVASGTVYAVQVLPWARKTDAGARTISTVVRHSGTEEDSSPVSLATTYTYVVQDIRTTKPGGGAFSVSDVNGMEVGVKVIS